jgi:hypothetical protein
MNDIVTTRGRLIDAAFVKRALPNGVVQLSKSPAKIEVVRAKQRATLKNRKWLEEKGN